MEYDESAIAIETIRRKLNELDEEVVAVDGGIFLKPSQCYHLSFHPYNLLFNTNCPEIIRKRVEEIFRRYIGKIEKTEEYVVDYSSLSIPSCVKEFKPRVFKKGDRWLAVPEGDMGSNLWGEGDSPGKALEHFVSLYAKEKENSL